MSYPQYAIYLMQAQSTAIAEIQTNVNTVKTEVAAVKVDVAAVKTDTNTLKTNTDQVEGYVDSIESKLGQMEYKTPRFGLFYLGTVVAGTYYTVLDVTGAGELNRVLFMATGGMNGATIELTIDGVVHTKVGLATMSTGVSESDAGTLMSWVNKVKFNVSLKVRVMQPIGTTQMSSNADYCLN